MPPQSSLAESKICYFSVSYIVYLIVQNFFFDEMQSQVLLSEEEAAGPAVDYSQDFRRYAYRDFAFSHAKLEGGVRPQALLKWAIAAKPRNQDDVVPIMQICKGILKDLMQEKIVFEVNSHDALQRQIVELRNLVEAKAAAETRLTAQLGDLRAQLHQAQAAAQQVQEEMGRALAQHALQLEHLQVSQREALARAEAECAARCGDCERRLRSAETVAEHRTRDFYKAHGALAARLQMKPREVVASWGLDDQREALRALLHEHRRAVESLRAADFQACAAVVRRDLARKVLEAIRVASPSWLTAVAEVLDVPVPELYRRVAGWYEQEKVITDDVRYRQQVGRAPRAPGRVCLPRRADRRHNGPAHNPAGGPVTRTAPPGRWRRSRGSSRART